MKKQLYRLGSNALIYGLGDAFGKLITLLLLPLFTHYLTPDDYGVLSILGIVNLIVTSVFSLGLGAAIGGVYFDGNNPAHKEKTTWTAATILFGSAIFMGMLALALSREISLLAFKTPDYQYIVEVSMFSYCFTVLSIPFMLYLQFEQRAKLFVAVSTFMTFISIVLDILVVVVVGAGVRGMVQADVVVQSLRLLLLVLPVTLLTRIRLSRTVGSELLRLSLPLIPAFIFLFIIQQSNKFFLERVRGLDATGIYSVGANLGTVMNLAVSAFTTAWTPYFMSFIDKRDEARALFGRILTYYVFGFGSLTLLFFIGAKPVVMVMTQAKFHDSYQSVGLTAGAYFLTGIFSLLLPGVYFAKEIKYIAVVQAGAAVVTLGLNFVLIPALGILGAGLVYALGVFAMAYFQHVWNQRRKETYLRVDYDWNRILKFGVIFILLAAATLIDRSLPLAVEIGISAVATLLLVAAVYALLTPYERKTLLTIVNFRQRLSLKKVEP